MKVLLVDPHPLERDQSASILHLAGHDVQSVSDPASALTVLTKQRFDVVVVEMVCPHQRRSGLEVVRGACNLEGRPQPYIVVTASRPTPGDVGDAFQAGADDFLRKPANRDELLARVDGLERSRKRSLRRLRHAKLEDVNKDPVALEAWRNVEIDICTDLAEMIGSPLVRLEGAELDPEKAQCLAQVALALPTDDYQIVVSIAADEATARTLALRLLETTTVDLMAMRDMVRELSNTAAASFKRSAALEGLTFTTGIPTDVTAATLRSPDAKATRRWAARDASGCILYGEAEIRRTSRELLPTLSLREGMVLVNDLTNGSGALLLRGGTRLTQSHLEHLKKAIGTTGLVEVSLAA